MGRITESLATFNSFLRSCIAIAVLGAAGGGGFYAYNQWYAKEHAVEAMEKTLAAAKAELAEREGQIATMKTQLTELQQQVERLETARRLLKLDQRLAEIEVVDQKTDPATGELTTSITFVELDTQGKRLTEPKKYDIKGDVVYVESWSVKFHDKYIEQNDLDRHTNICLLRRIYGEKQAPEKGYPLDTQGTLPAAPDRVEKVSEFEAKIWNDFWAIANDDKKAAELGIRTLHGEAPFMKVEKGKRYLLEGRASGGTTFRKPEEAPPSPQI